MHYKESFTKCRKQTPKQMPFALRSTEGIDALEFESQSVSLSKDAAVGRAVHKPGNSSPREFLHDRNLPVGVIGLARSEELDMRGPRYGRESHRSTERIETPFALD